MYEMPTEARGGCQIPGTGVTDTCESICRYLKLNPGSLQEHPMLLTQKTALQ